MRGHIVKRYKDSYTIVLPLGTDSQGKRKQQWVSVKGTKKEAEKRLAELLHQLDTGNFMKPGKTTLAEYLERWLKDYAWPNLSPRTAEGYESIVRQHLIPKLGNITLTQLKAEHLQKYYSETLARGRCDGKEALSQTTLSHHHTCLHRALKVALRWGLLNRNPADEVTPPHPQRSEMQTMSEDEMKAFLEAAKSTPYYSLFYTLLFTGMRRSEILALRWSDIDLPLNQIHVSRSLHHLRDGSTIYRAPKTAKGRRMISLSPSSAVVLRHHKEQQEAYCATLGLPFEDDSLVFCQLDGGPLLPNTISHVWSKIVTRAGLKHFRLHDSRHTHASLLLKNNVHPKIVQERLGHATISTTLDLYSHVAPGLQEAAAAAFDKLVSPKPENEAVAKVG